MLDVKVSGEIHASPEKVYAFLADLENWPKWQSDMKLTELMEGERGKPGARYPKRWARPLTRPCVS